MYSEQPQLKKIADAHRNVQEALKYINTLLLGPANAITKFLNFFHRNKTMHGSRPPILPPSRPHEFKLHAPGLSAHHIGCS